MNFHFRNQVPTNIIFTDSFREQSDLFYGLDEGWQPRVPEPAGKTCTSGQELRHLGDRLLVYDTSGHMTSRESNSAWRRTRIVVVPRSSACSHVESHFPLLPPIVEGNAERNQNERIRHPKCFVSAYQRNSEADQTPDSQASR